MKFLLGALYRAKEKSSRGTWGVSDGLSAHSASNCRVSSTVSSMKSGGAREAGHSRPRLTYAVAIPTP